MAANAFVQFEDQKLHADNARLRQAIVAAGVAIPLLTFAVCVLIFRPRVLPYVVMVNAQGEPISVAQPVTGTQTLNEVVVKWALAEFIRNAKTVTANVDEQKEHLRTAYAFAREQAAKALTAYYHDGEHDPFTLAGKGWVEVRIVRTPLKLPAPDTYQVDWVEAWHEYSGTVARSTSWQATLKAVTLPPDTEDGRNPLGLYVTTLDWSPEVPQ